MPLKRQCLDSVSFLKPSLADLTDVCCPSFPSHIHFAVLATYSPGSLIIRILPLPASFETILPFLLLFIFVFSLDIWKFPQHYLYLDL